MIAVVAMNGIIAKAYSAVNTKKWNKTEKKCKVFIDHKELDEITKTMQEAKQYIIFQDAENAMLKISLLHILLEQIPQNESITLENIL